MRIKIDSREQHATENVTFGEAGKHVTLLSAAATEQRVKKDRPQRATKLCAHRGGVLLDAFPPKDGLGDLVANGLKAIGLSKSAYQKAKASVGLKEECGCNWRQQVMNKAASFMPGLGKGKGDELQRIIELDAIGKQLVRECSIHQKCLPQIKVSTENLPIIQQTGFNPCQGCPDRTNPPAKP